MRESSILAWNLHPQKPFGELDVEDTRGYGWASGEKIDDITSHNARALEPEDR
jgi:hypothetical protein